MSHQIINCNTKCPPQVNNSLYTSSADFPQNCFLGYVFIYFSIFLIYAFLCLLFIPVLLMGKLRHILFFTIKSEFSSSTIPLLTSLYMVFVETPILSAISLCVFFSFKLASIIHLSTSVKCLPFSFSVIISLHRLPFVIFCFCQSNYNMNSNSMLFYFLLSGHFILQLIIFFCAYYYIYHYYTIF